MDLDIAEILFEDGSVRFRYSRYLAADGTKWIRQGLFVAYYPNGQIASEGDYKDGVEDGLWKSFHENGQLAAKGEYKLGVETGNWDFWDTEGKPE